MVKTEPKERAMRSCGAIGSMPIGIGMRESRSKKQTQASACPPLTQRVVTA